MMTTDKRKCRFMEKIKAHAHIEIEALPEDIAIRGNAMASGDNALDKRVEDQIIEDLESGNEWAWCTVHVRVILNGLTADDFLGACSYKSEEDFKKNGYYDDMVDQCIHDLLNKMEDINTFLKGL